MSNDYTRVLSAAFKGTEYVAVEPTRLAESRQFMSSVAIGILMSLSTLSGANGAVPDSFGVKAPGWSAYRRASPKKLPGAFVSFHDRCERIASRIPRSCGKPRASLPHDSPRSEH